MTQINKSFGCKRGLKKIDNQNYDTNISAQRSRLLERLKAGSVTTLEARRELDILAPAPRVFELRHLEGYNIQTHWVTEVTDLGVRHRVARYFLCPGKYRQVWHV